MKQLGVLLLPLNAMLVNHRVPSMKQVGVLLLPLYRMLVHHKVPSMMQLRVLLLPLDARLVQHRIPSMKQVGVLLLPLDGMLVCHRVIPGTHICSSVEKDTAGYGVHVNFSSFQTTVSQSIFFNLKIFSKKLTLIKNYQLTETCTKERSINFQVGRHYMKHKLIVFFWFK